MITIDVEAGSLAVGDGDGVKTYALGSPEAFEVISEVWLRSGWDNKYVYTFSWLGRPIIQLPEDMIRMQEVISALQPDVIIETGIAHGGSLVFYASLCKALGRGRVIGIDIEIRPHNRQAIEAHALFPFITLFEGSSTDPKVVERVRRELLPDQTVLVLLDSNHTKEHVLAELNAYGPLVTPGSYIVAMDGIMGQLAGAPRTQPDWTWNNPRQAALEFAASHPGYEIQDPNFLFNESPLTRRITYWPGGFIKRVN